MADAVGEAHGLTYAMLDAVALLDASPFGQPGVETGQNATSALMGREGCESLRGRLQAQPAGSASFQLT